MFKKIIVANLLIILLNYILGNPVMSMESKIVPSTKPLRSSTTNPIIDTTFTSLTIASDGRATSFARITGAPDITDQVRIFLYLETYQKGAWTPIAVWTQSYGGYFGSLTGIAFLPSSGYYRTRTNFYAYSGPTIDQTIAYSGTVRY